jgi:hypothetical protein
MPSEHRMVEVGGTRYRVEDARRLGLVTGPSAPPVEKKRKPRNKSRLPEDKADGDGSADRPD